MRELTSMHCSFLKATQITAFGLIMVFRGSEAYADAQWSVTDLGPGFGTGVHGDQQVGHSVPDGINSDSNALLWYGTAASMIDLHGANSSGSSQALATSGSHQVGYRRGDIASGPGGAIHRAVMWSGTLNSMVWLGPDGSSEALAVAGSQQAGFRGSHAGVWAGSAESWVDIHPAQASSSRALGTNGTQQAGFAIVEGTAHASLWSGSAASWVDLGPSLAQDSSANAISGTQQAGYATFAGARHAGIWTGSAASWNDLHPAGAESSELFGTVGLAQVGVATFGGVQHAGLWYGSASSWQDLGSFLPTGFSSSEAKAIWTDGSLIQITGSGINPALGARALLWTGTVPEPVAAAFLCIAAVGMRRQRNRDAAS